MMGNCNGTGPLWVRSVVFRELKFRGKNLLKRRECCDFQFQNSNWERTTLSSLTSTTRRTKLTINTLQQENAHLQSLPLSLSSSLSSLSSSSSSIVTEILISTPYHNSQLVRTCQSTGTMASSTPSGMQQVPVLNC